MHWFECFRYEWYTSRFLADGWRLENQHCIFLYKRRWRIQRNWWTSPAAVSNLSRNIDLYANGVFCQFLLNYHFFFAKWFVRLYYKIMLIVWNNATTKALRHQHFPNIVLVLTHIYISSWDIVLYTWGLINVWWI